MKDAKFRHYFVPFDHPREVTGGGPPWATWFCRACCMSWQYACTVGEDGHHGREPCVEVLGFPGAELWEAWRWWAR